MQKGKFLKSLNPVLQQHYLRVLRLGLLFLLACFGSTAFACTDVRITAQDGSVLITRSMEFAEDLKSNLRNSPRGSSFKSSTPDGKPALSWKSKYGYLFADGLNQPMVVDGMNEKGLSFGYLYLPGETKYQTVSADKADKALPYYLLGDWVLGNFETVEEVKNALSNIVVFEQEIPGIPNIIFPVHASIADASGKGIVVEFINGKMKISDNEIGIFTNAPIFEWQVTNLRNYVNLSPYNPKPITANGLTFIATGQGAGMMGLPGDISPPSRFVKSAFMLKVALPVADAEGALNLGEHIINNVDIPLGLARAKTNNGEQVELTQWVVFKDLKNKKFYYRTYNNMTLRYLSFDKIDFSEKATRFVMPMAGAPNAVDMTKEFQTAQNKVKSNKD